MRNCFKTILATIASLIPVIVFCQPVTISGNVRNASSKEVVPAVSVVVKGTKGGTFTDDKGDFKLSTSKQTPFILVITSIGFEPQEVNVSDASSFVQVDVKPASSLGAEVVVSASRVPERILESPVSIERINSVAIRNATVPQYYDAIRALKGVDVTNSSLTFTSITTRGFNGSGNPRFNQCVDGMDNQSPGLNFSVAAIVGLTELDVDNMELLPGASSALYGSGGMNGTLLMSSKDPFKYQGLSFQIKQGVMHLGGGDGKMDPVKPSPYYDWAFRWAQKVSDKFAFKINAQLVQAKDWVATDQTNYSGAGTGSKSHTIAGNRDTDPNYDGVNVYGDETSQNMQTIAGLVQNSINSGVLAASGGALNLVNTFNNYLPANATPQQVAAFTSTYLPAIIGGIPSQLQPQVVPYINQLLPFYVGLRSGAIPNQNVSRTGFTEYQLLNNNTVNFKVSGGLYYKLTSNTQMSLTANWGTGNTVYTGSDRYSLKDFKMGQYKFEIKNDNWFIRTYTTQERAGSSFNATITTQLFNEAWDPSSTWYPEFIGAYLQAVQAGAPPNSAAAYNAARQYADRNKPVPGTAAFTQLYNQVASKPIPQGGLLLDKSNLYHTEGQYNLTSLVKFAEVLVGASWRQYVLNSEGTIFADTLGPRHTNEYGAYIQVSKKIADILKLTGSVRYDKNQNFDGKFTPRLAAVLSVAKDQNIRASYQNAYRFPSNQNQWINLNTGVGILIGGLASAREYYHFDTNPVFNAVTFLPQTFGKYKPESVNSYELGYKGLFNKRLLIDLYGYYSQYKDFIGRVSVVQSTSGNPAAINPNDPSTYQGYSVSVNSANKVSTYGWGFSVDYILDRGFSIGFNVSSDMIHNPDSTFATYFNTPKYRTNVSFSNNGFGHQKRFGFSIQYRWQDNYYTEADFKQGPVSAFSTLDAMVSYKCTGIRSLIKIGATNLLNHYYVSQFGNPAFGGLYYVSFGYNIF